MVSLAVALAGRWVDGHRVLGMDGFTVLEIISTP